MSLWQTLSQPINLIALLALVAGGWWGVRRLRRWRRRKFSFRCAHCERDLHGQRLHGDPEGRLRCPFCGDDVEEELPMRLTR